MVSVSGALDIPNEVVTDNNGQASISISTNQDIDEESMILTAETENGIKATTTLLFNINTNPPDALIITTSKENGNILLHWDSIKRAEYYTVMRKIEGGQFVIHGEYIKDSFFPDGDLTSGNTYYYMVTASNQYGESAASSVVKVDYNAPMENLGTLAVDKNTVFTNKSTTLIFRISPEGKLANNASISLVLTDESGKILDTVTQLRDDGNVSTGDDIKSDGVYSGKTTIYQPGEEVLRYKAYVNIPINDSMIDLFSKNTLNVNIVAPLSTSQISLSQTISSEAIEIFNQTISSEGQDAAAQNTLEFLRTAIGVTEVGYSTESKSIWYIISSGIKCVIPVTQPDTNGSMSSITMNFDSDGTKTYYPLYSNISTALGQSGYAAQLIEDSNVTLSIFKTLSSYKVIVINSHGNMFQDTPYICSGEVATSDKIKLYEQDIKTGRLIIVTTQTGSYFGFMPEFIEENNSSLNDAVIFLSSCRGLQNSKLWDAFKALGAKTLFGFDGDVYKDYAAEISRVLFYSMLNDGLTAGQAYDWTIKELAESDMAWKLKNNVIPPQKTPARFKMYGEREVSLKFEQLIVNSDFENAFTEWTKTGDARIISQLGPLMPVSGNNMAIISTGLGSINSSSSAIEQSFYVPENSKTLSFDYNVVSEEPMEFVGSRYDDAFRCTVQLLTGTNQVAYESVNTSKWNYVSGIDFDAGDSTTYMTGWKHIDLDVSQYQGQYVTLKFHVWDVGDSAYDTAALIDNVNIDGSSNGSTSVNNFNDREYLTWPSNSLQVTLPFGAVDNLYSGTHKGIDIQGSIGDDVFASADGEVAFTGVVEGFGNVIYINSYYLGKYIQIRCAHLDTIYVHEGDYVYSGSIIGSMGNSGTVTEGCVLHFEILESMNDEICSIEGDNCKNVDPMSYLQPISDNELQYLSRPFSIGNIDDEFDTMGIYPSIDDWNYILNTGLNDEEVFLRKIVAKMAKEKEGVKFDSDNTLESMKILIWHPSDESAEVNLNNRTKRFAVKYGDRVLYKRLVINLNDFMCFFYPSETIPVYRGYNGQPFSVEFEEIYIEDVKKIQIRLNELGYVGLYGKQLNPDGYFGSNTESAVNDFKNVNGLGNDVSKGWYGKVGDQTWKCLFSPSAKKAPVVKDSPVNPITVPTVSQWNYDPNNIGTGVDYEKPTRTQIVNYIIKRCREIGIPENMGLATAWTESEMTQFNSKGSTFIAGKDHGLMQINIGHKKGASDWGKLDESEWNKILVNWRFNVDYGLNYLKYCYDTAKKANEDEKGYQEAIKKTYSIFWASGLIKEQNLARAAYSMYNANVTWRYRTKKTDAPDPSKYSKLIIAYRNKKPIYGADGKLVVEYDARDKNFWDHYRRMPWCYGTKLERQKMVYGSGSRYKTKAQADKNMVTFQVDVWVWETNKQTQKQVLVSKKKSLTVNKAIKDSIIAVFKEIYEHPSKPAIKMGTTSAYNWRDGTFEHPQGLAIDISWDDNYMIRADGSIVAGKEWNPTTNQYSLHPAGVIVQTFKKYGWDWGGDWYTSKDYMHFSFIQG
ncbi:MAG: peptidoglycan DD-metalloendopeptidase family protein [Bacillota bacterium]